MQLTPLQSDVLRELLNIGVGKAAGLINHMVKTHVKLDIPEVLVLNREDFQAFLAARGDTPLSTVRLGFRGAFQGWAGLLFPKASANWLVNQLVGGSLDISSMDKASLYVGTIQEVGNIVLNGVLGAIVNTLGLRIDYFPPDYQEASLAGLFASIPLERSAVLMVKARFALETGLVEGEIVILFQLETFESLIQAIDAMIASGGAA